MKMIPLHVSEKLYLPLAVGTCIELPCRWRGTEVVLGVLVFSRRRGTLEMEKYLF